MADPNKLGGLEEHFGGDEDKPTDNIHIRVIDTTVAKFDLVLREKLEEEGALSQEEIHWAGGEADYSGRPPKERPGDMNAYIPKEYKASDA
jgi:hypothetical protein